MKKMDKIEFAAAILKKVEPLNSVEYGKWKSISKSQVLKIALLRVLSPQTRVTHLRSLEYSTDLNTMLTDLSDGQIEDILRRHQIRFPKRKVRAVKLARSTDWITMLRDMEHLSRGHLEDERDARIRVMNHTYGMGLKTASDFLKDIGFSKHLAVLDSRNLKFLIAFGLASPNLKAGRLSNSRIYYELEDIENDIASKLGISVSELDERIMVYTGTSSEIPHKI